MKKLLSASILSSDILNLQTQVNELEAGGVDMLHIDVMDGSFVPNITFGANVVKAIKKATKIPLDVHLMIENPEQHIQSFIEAGSDILTVHLETAKHPDRLLRKIKNYGVKSGIALLPSTLPQNIEYIIDVIDLVLVMSVNPGFGGQQFIDSQLNKIKELKRMLKPNHYLSVDGGINLENIAKISLAGANMFVTGSYLYQNKSVKENIQNLKSIIKG